jgi:hypothetical protein
MPEFDEINTVGRVLGDLICEKYEIPRHLVNDRWEATGDSDAVLVDMNINVEMTMAEFDELLERAKSIAAPVHGE